jgi:hypothetical protein
MQRLGIKEFWVAVQYLWVQPELISYSQYTVIEKPLL